MIDLPDARPWIKFKDFIESLIKSDGIDKNTSNEVYKMDLEFKAKFRFNDKGDIFILSSNLEDVSKP